MTVKDRILCALSFHGPLMDTDMNIVSQYTRSGISIGEPRIVGSVKKCSLCNREVNCR